MLEIKHIEKSYKQYLALQDIQLTLENGIHALLGPNGAGKSTLMRIICNQSSCDKGEVLYNGKSIKDNKLHYYANLGYAPQQQGLYDEFTAERFLTYIALLKNIPKNQIKEEVMRCAQYVHLEEVLSKKCKTYSGGMKQRLLVASALLHNPHVLLFDEPTAGLDPKERVSLRQVFQSLKKDHIVLIATHIVSDIETIADNVIFLKKGTIIEQGSLLDLKDRYPAITSLEELYLTMFQEEDQ